MFEDLRIGLAVFLCAAAVKLLDDWLDKDHDQAVGCKNWAVFLGPGAAVYAALLLAMAAAVSARVSLALFFASYSIGMFSDLNRKLPSRLMGWQEVIIVCGLGTALLGWRSMLFSLLFITAIQLFDDCLDAAADLLAGQRNLANRFGMLECLLAGLLFMLGAWWLEGDLFPPVLIGTMLFYACLLAFSGVKIWN